MPHGRYTEHPLSNYSAGSYYLPPKRHFRYRLSRTSFPHWPLRAQCLALAPQCRMCGIRSTRFRTTAPVAITFHPNAIAGTVSSVRPSHIGFFWRNRSIAQGLASPCRMGVIRSTRIQATAPVAITCLPNAIAGAGSSVRPSHSGFWGRLGRNGSTAPALALAPPCRRKINSKFPQPPCYLLAVTGCAEAQPRKLDHCHGS